MTLAMILEGMMTIMNVTLISNTEDPEFVITLAAATCYSDLTLDKLKEKCLNKEYQDKMVKMLLENGHESPLEHANFTFFIEGISRSVSHQLVRHRIASYSQRSQRYTTMRPEEFTIPESIKNNPHAQALFEQHLKDTFDLYNAYIEDGIPKEDAREILPNATQTSLVMTMNLRELRHFMELRMCMRAQSGIRELADKIYSIIKSEFPILIIGCGPKCWFGKCTEKHKTKDCPKEKI